jgi:NAD(P)H dehydrogenase (quinone)
LEVDMKIGVSGGSGQLGRAVVSELRRRADGHEVVAITRTPETVSGPARGRFGDYNRPEGLAEAYAGLDRLLIITTVDPVKRGAQNVAAIDAAVRAGVIALGEARKRRNDDELAKPLNEVQLVQVQPGQSRSGQVSNECCHSSGDRRVRSVHSE